jgi:hypothetical protein
MYYINLLELKRHYFSFSPWATIFIKPALVMGGGDHGPGLCRLLSPSLVSIVLHNTPIGQICLTKKTQKKQNKKENKYK